MRTRDTDVDPYFDFGFFSDGETRGWTSIWKWDLEKENGMQNTTLSTIRQAFVERGKEKYGDEEVTQLQHALHCARLAMDQGADNVLVVAAFLHDIGHILATNPLPSHLEQNLDDGHEERGWTFLSNAFPKVVADAVRLHVAAKRWLCTVEPSYISQLSPTSCKSYWDQGGPMSEEERVAFESHPHHVEAVAVRRWDDLAKDPQAVLPSLEAVLQRVEALLVV